MEAFQLGEKVIYPQFGLGTIAEVTEKQVESTGQGTSRRSAEQAAAQQMLLMLTGDDE